MTQAAKLKDEVRRRASKTGESYTAARRQVLAARGRTARWPAPRKPSPTLSAESTADRKPGKGAVRAPRGEVSDAATRKATGHGLAHWFAILDAFGTTHGHTKTVDYLYTSFKLKAWHGQMIVVTWERARGLRQENQSCTGDFQVSVSRAIAGPLTRIVDLVNEPGARSRWLADEDPALARALEEAFAAGKTLEVKKPGYARMRYKWLSSVVELRATEKDGRTSVVADSSQLPDAQSVGIRRAAFASALDRLRDRTAVG